MNTFTVNGKEYNAKPFDFNLLCDLEEMGISLEQARRKPMSMARAYFGLCTGQGEEYAGNEINAHVIGGGKLDDLMTAMSDEMEKSDFFRNLNKTAETEVTENPTTENEKE